MSGSPSGPSPEPIRVVIAEDQEMVLGALTALLDMETDIDVVGAAGDGELALEKVRELAPDVLIADIEMPLRSGIEVAEELAEHPTRVIIVTTFARPGFLQRAMKAGVKGYLLKARPARELADAVRRVQRGLLVVDPELAAEAWAEEDPLTEREREALRRAGLGDTNKAIAKRLGLSPGTVRNYLSTAMDKLGAANRIEAARIAREKGWL